MARFFSIISVVLLAASSPSLAEPFFGLPAEIEMEPGMTVSVPVTGFSLNSGPVEGMSLFVELDAPIQLTDIDLHSGTIWPPSPIVIFEACTYLDCPGPVPITDPQHGYADVTTTSAIVLPDQGKVANLLITAPADTPVGTTSLLRLEWTKEGLRSHFWPQSLIEPVGLPTTLIRIVPEPTTACLITASALWLAARRGRRT